MHDELDRQKGLPHSEEAERAVLAGILLDPRLLANVGGRLTPDDFYSEAHRAIFEAMLAVQAGGVEVDLRTLQGKLEQQDRLERVGGIAYLAGLDMDLPDLGRMDTYVELVKERSIRRRLIDACGQVTRSCFDGGLEAQEALSKAEELVLALGEETIHRGFVPLATIFEQTLADLEERPDKGFVGLRTGFIDFDEMTRGLSGGQLVIIAGRPGMGKTSLALNVAQHVAIREGKAVGVFSLEMSQSELSLRVLSSESEVPFGNLRSGHMSQRQWRELISSARKIGQAPLYIDDSANPTLLEVASKARRLRAEARLDLLVLDYLQLMQAGGRYENRNLEIAAITRHLKVLAKELDIPVIALSQLSRQPERRSGDHRPQLSDLRESGSIEQDADLVAFVYREEVYEPDDPTKKGLAELIVAKHRSGETGRIPLVFMGKTTSFRNLAKGAMSDEAPF